MLAHEIVSIGGFKVVGPAIVTSNEREMTKDGLIVELHEHFIMKQMTDLIHNKKDDRLIAVYTDYESDESGEYVYAIGHQVLTDECPRDFECFEIPAGEYLHFSSERGYLGEVLPALWREIWRRSQAGELGVERSFETDFEFHNYEDRDSPDVMVDVYLSIR